MMETEATIRDILSGWTELSVAQAGEAWVIAGRYNSKAHAGGRVDGVSLAHDLKRIAEAEDAPRAAPPLADEEDAPDLGAEMLDAEEEAGETPAHDESATDVRDAGPEHSGDAGEELGDVVGDRAEGGSSSYPGIAILENELERRRNQVLRMISDAKRARLAIACDRSREDWLAEQAQRYIALGALGGDIPAETRMAYAEFCALKDRKDAIQREALQREDAAATADIDQLQNIAVGMEQGWP